MFGCSNYCGPINLIRTGMWLDQVYSWIVGRYSLNIWDVGGQKSLRAYWRNYFECTEGLVWVVDCSDKRRLEDCKAELHSLLVEEVGDWFFIISTYRTGIMFFNLDCCDSMNIRYYWLVFTLSHSTEDASS